ncbi:type I toxin-antitoxin system Fst family toxin [Listeria monocytogenes]|nr:type I toxin-antitoxin system Fst family toxin [Listeria monocytogenes]TYV33083.1 type I toxin-antitoxin system Fst family toxin [Listeria monocytogenes]
MFTLFSSIVAPIVVGCVIAWFKQWLEKRHNKN